MSAGTPAFRKRRLEPLGQRLRRLIRRTRGGYAKPQRVYLVEIGGARLKQIVLADSAVAGQMAANLQELDATGVFPRLVARYRNEIWVEFIDGDLLASGVVPPLVDIAAVFAPLYRSSCRLVPAADVSVFRDSECDLALLATAGVIGTAVAGRLRTALHDGTPAEAWVGYDYGDARAQNFIRASDGRLRIIDIESIRRDSLLGLGVARALMRWPELDRDALLQQLEHRGAPQFRGYLGCLDLVFAAGWTKRCLLQGKSTAKGKERLARLAEQGLRA